MKFWPFSFTKTLLRTSSRFNRDIQVVQKGNKKELYVNGIQQAGSYDETIFDLAFNKFSIEKFPIKNALLLGVGGGYLIKKIKLLHPSAHIVAVDIDSEIISIAQQYFGLDTCTDVTFAVADAQDFIKSASKATQRYNFIVIDLYVGDDVPAFVETEVFIKEIKHVLTRSGRVHINYQHQPSYDERRKAFERVLHRVFKIVHAYPVFPHRNIEYLLSSS